MFKDILNRFKWQMMAATVLSIMSALAGLGMLKIVTVQLSLLGSGQSAGLAVFLMFVAAVAGVLVFGLASRYLLAKLSARVVYEFRDMLVKRLMSTSYAEVEQIGGHRILAAMKTDASKLSDGLLVMPGFVYSLVTVLLCLGYMVYTSWQLFLIVFALIAVIILVARFFLRYGLQHYYKLRAHEDVMFRGLKTLVDGVKELSINANRRRFMFYQVLSPNFADIRDRSIKVSVVFTMLSSMTSTLVFFVIGVIVFGSQVWLSGIALSVIVSFVLTILYMVNPLENVVGSLNQFSDFAASYRNIAGLPLAAEGDFEAKTKCHRQQLAEMSWQTLSAEQVTFHYRHGNSDDYAFHVGPLDVQFRRGEAIFLTGGNGSGKSTFSKLLVGLYQPDGGRICLDDLIIGDSLAVSDYQQLFSTIFSDFHLFEHVLDENGDPGPDEVIAGHLEKLELAQKVTSENGKLSSVAMSQGQKKRLALMMSYLENTPICLYDEWAADQDPRFRNIFYQEIIPELKRRHKLVIVVTHDDRYFHLADQLLKFENGQLIENVRSAPD